MTVSTTTNKKEYAGLAAQDTFPYDFEVALKADMNVYFDSVLQPAGDWSITNLGNPAGGDVILNAPLAANTTVTLLRTVAFTQAVDYQPLDAFPADTHEGALDKLTFLMQQLNEQYERSIRLPVGHETVNVELPEPVAENVLGWNAAGTALENQPVPTGGIVTDGSITASKLATDAVETVKIKDGAVTSAKLAAREAAVTGFVRCGNVYYKDGTAAAGGGLIVIASATGTFETYGPTGSGADNESVMFDSLPASARAILLDVRFNINGDGTTASGIFLHGAVGGVTPVAAQFHMGGLAEDSGTIGIDSNMQVWVPCDANQIFQLSISRTSSGSPSSTGCQIRGAEGYMVDA